MLYHPLHHYPQLIIIIHSSQQCTITTTTTTTIPSGPYYTITRIIWQLEHHITTITGTISQPHLSNRRLITAQCLPANTFTKTSTRSPPPPSPLTLALSLTWTAGYQWEMVDKLLRTYLIREYVKYIFTHVQVYCRTDKLSLFSVWTMNLFTILFQSKYTV